MRRYLVKVLATLLVAFSASALAMGLGEIRLNSYLNQRLDAEIELVSAAADETDTLVVQLASRAAYDRVGLDRPAALSSLSFEVVRRPNGTAYIKVTSKEPIREPFLTFLIEADWSRGRLLREYTLLLDPPTFADREAAKPAEAQTPVSQAPAQATSPSLTGAAAGTAAATAAAAESMSGPDDDMAREPVAMAEPAAESPSMESADSMTTAQGDAVMIPPLEADREDSASQPSYSAMPSPAPEIGGTYGAIQRNETLWGIARQLKPDESITMNQMMVSIYRANPEAFDGNMNRLKQGYILRIPEFSEVTSLSRAEAFREAKRMNDDWNASRGVYADEDFRVEEPAADDSLSLVAPEEEYEPEVGTGIGAGGEADDIGSPGDASVDLGDDDIDAGAVDLVEDDAESTDRLIDIEDESMQAVQSGAGEESTEPAMDESLDLPPLPGESGDTMADEPMVDETADTTDSMTADAGMDEYSEDTMADSGTETADDAATTPEEPESSSVATRRKPEPTLVDQVIEFVTSPIGLGVLGGLLLIILLGAYTIQKKRAQARKQAASQMADWMAEEESGEDDDVTVIAGDSEDQTEGGDGDDEAATIFGRPDEMAGSGTEAISDDDATQMIPPEQQGGHEDTMIGNETAVMDENDPMSEADFNMAYGLYDQAADVVKKAVGREPERADLKAKLCEIHFASDSKDEFLDAARALKEQTGGEGSDWNNVAIMGRQIAPGDELFGEGDGGSADVDLDFGASEDEVTGTPADFGETMIGSQVDEEPAAPAEEAPASGGDDLDFDLDIGGGDSSAPAEEASAEPAPAAGGDDMDFDLDFGGGDSAPAAEAEESSDSDEEAVDLDASDMDLGDMDFGDLGGDAASEPEEEEPASAASEDSYDADSTQTEFDKALSELSNYVDTNLPEGDAGDAVSDEDSGGELNLDEFAFDKDSEAPDDDFGGAELGSDGDEDDDLGEIGTKLDLARAYVDMGDPDGAKSILQEVLEDGDDQQKQEAQDLLDKL